VEYCGANKTSGGKCKQPAGLGTGHFGVGRCKFHGGATPTHEKSGAEELVKRGLLFYGEPIEIDPHEALILEVERTAGHVAYLQLETEALDPSDFENRDHFDLKYKQTLGLYRAERKHLVNVCQAALNAGVEERRVKVAERTGAAIVKILEGVLADLGLSKKQKEKAPEIVRRHMTVLEGGKAA
jgi:hypothetical protein